MLRFAGRVLPSALTLALVVSPSPAKSDDPPVANPRPIDESAINREDLQGSRSSQDCGLLALYLMLRDEGRSINFAALRDQLPPPGERGYSFRELIDAARAIGYPLNAIRLKEGDGPLDRPAIVLLKQGVHAHFVVVRPVGLKGTMVQVIDPRRDPVLIDSERMYGSESWTGLALILDRPNWWSRIAGGIAAILAVAIVALMLKSHSRIRRAGMSPSVR